MVNRIDEVWVQTQNLNVQDLGRRRGCKTHLYEVRLRKNGSLQGVIQWLNRAIGYTFVFSNSQYAEEATEVAAFVTAEWRKSHPHKVPNFKKRRVSRIRNLLQKPGGGGLDKRYAPVLQ